MKWLDPIEAVNGIIYIVLDNNPFKPEIHYKSRIAVAVAILDL